MYKIFELLYTQSVYTAAIVAVIYTCLQTINHSLLYLYTYLTIYSFIYLFIYLLIEIQKSFVYFLVTFLHLLQINFPLGITAKPAQN